MMLSLAANDFLIISLLVFVTVMLLLEGLYLMWRAHKGPEARKFHSRLQALSASRDTSQQTNLLKQRLTSELPVLQRWVQSLPRMRMLDRFILQAGLNWSATKLMVICSVFGVMGWLFFISVAHQTFLTSVMAAALLAACPLLYVVHKRHKRLGRIERQLPDALDLLTRALRAGHAFSSALKMAGEEMHAPIAGELRIAHDEVNYGVSLQQALTNLSDRVPLTDLRYFVVAVLIQRDSGGNLTEILGNLSHLIRERAKLMAKVRVLSSEGRMSGWILGAMPFFIGGGMYLGNPEFMSPLWTDPIGIAILKYLVVTMVLGIVVLRKMARIRF